MENRDHRNPSALENVMGSMWKEEDGRKAVRFKLQHTLESSLILLKCRFREGPEMLHFLQAPRGHQCCWSLHQTLRSKDMREITDTDYLTPSSQPCSKYVYPPFTDRQTEAENSYVAQQAGGI